MASKVLFIALLVLLGATIYQAEARVDPDAHMKARHEKWMAKYGRVYKNEAEKAERFKIFKSNAEHIDAVNAKGLSYKLGENKYTDLTNNEFAARNTYKPRLHKAAPVHHSKVSDVALPDSVDWRTLGAVTPVKDEGPCECSWAIAAADAVEGITEINTGNLISLSAPELSYCVPDSNGCSGGTVQSAFQWIVSNGGIASEDEYPCTASDGTCSAKSMSNVATISNFANVATGEHALQAAVANQPVAVAVDASGSAFQFYSGGIFTGRCGTNLDHSMTVVGYGSENGLHYWIVKNSWGTDWGESGYIRMKILGSSPTGLCGIATDASYPIY